MNPGDVLRLMRPRQWTKNLAVFAGIIFSGNLADTSQLLRVGLAFIALCLLAGGLYAFNDVADAARDREHPVKRDRPVASGRIGRSTALAIAVVLLAAGMVLSALLDTPFLLAATAYVVLQVLYGLLLKNVAIVDMLVISAGFVIRAIAGALVIDVPVSPWLVLCTGLLALFLAAAKRRHELILLREMSSQHRPVLSQYSAELLDSFMVTLSASTVTSYALYTFFETRGQQYLMMATIPFVIYGILRYQYLVLHRGRGGTPEEVLLGDRPILTDIALWIGAVIVIIYLVPATA